MCCLGMLKKVVPFVATFVVGLLVTSIFISVAAPSFTFKKRGWNKHRQYHRQIERENRELKLENFRLERKLAEIEKQGEMKNAFEFDDLQLDVPPPPLAPIPPAKAR